MDEHSVSRWIRGLAAGNQEAEEGIWRVYFQQLVELARRHLGALPRRVADEEDIALSALNSFFMGAREGKFPQLADRDDLWKLLFVIATRKSLAQRRRHFAVTRPDQRMARAGDPAELQRELEAAIGREPSPDFAAQCAEELRLRLAELPDDACRQIAIWRLQGQTNREIADLLGTYEVKVERKLRLIRQHWSTAFDNLAHAD